MQAEETTTGRHEGEGGPNALEEALRLIDGLAERAKADPGVVFRMDVLAALSLIRQGRPDEWARLRKALKDAGVSLRDLDRNIPRVC